MRQRIVCVDDVQAFCFVNVQDRRGDSEVMRGRSKERVWRALCYVHLDGPGGTNEAGWDGITEEVHAVTTLR